MDWGLIALLLLVLIFGGGSLWIDRGITKPN